MSESYLTVTHQEAKAICARLEIDASWDKAGSGYYTLKRQLMDMENDKQTGGLMSAEVSKARLSFLEAIEEFSTDGPLPTHVLVKLCDPAVDTAFEDTSNEELSRMIARNPDALSRVVTSNSTLRDALEKALRSYLFDQLAPVASQLPRPTEDDIVAE